MKILLICFICALISVQESHSQASLMVHDTRHVTTTPDNYMQNFQVNFKTGASVLLPELYYTVVGLRGWVDNTGGKSHELAFSAQGQVLMRSGYSPQWESWRKFLVTDINGNVGVGVEDTKGYKLAVAGSIIAESIKVQLQGAWPDYVFKNEYNLPSLESTKFYIQKNGHLPGIPSAEEVSTSGLDIGMMNVKLLEKIEELTLHLIELKNDTDLQKKEQDKYNSSLLKEIELIKIRKK